MKKKELARLGTSERRSALGFGGRLPSDVKVIYNFGKTVEELKGELRSNVFFRWSQTRFGLPPS